MNHSFARKFHSKVSGAGALDYVDDRAKSPKPLINVTLFELSALCGVGSFVILLVQLARTAP